MDRIMLNSQPRSVDEGNKRRVDQQERTRSTKKPSVTTSSSSSSPVVHEGGASEASSSAVLVGERLGGLPTPRSSLEQVTQMCMALCEKVKNGTGILPKETDALKQLSQRTVSEFNSAQLAEIAGAEDGAVRAGSPFNDKYTENSFNYTKDCIPLFEASGSATCIAKQAIQFEGLGLVKEPGSNYSVQALMGLFHRQATGKYDLNVLNLWFIPPEDTLANRINLYVAPGIYDQLSPIIEHLKQVEQEVVCEIIASAEGVVFNGITKDGCFSLEQIEGFKSADAPLIMQSLAANKLINAFREIEKFYQIQQIKGAFLEGAVQYTPKSDVTCALPLIFGRENTDQLFPKDRAKWNKSLDCLLKPEKLNDFLQRPDLLTALTSQINDGKLNLNDVLIITDPGDADPDDELFFEAILNIRQWAIETLQKDIGAPSVVVVHGSNKVELDERKQSLANICTEFGLTEDVNLYTEDEFCEKSDLATAQYSTLVHIAKVTPALATKILGSNVMKPNFDIISQS